MRIELKLFASLARYMPDQGEAHGAKMIDIQEGTTIRDLLKDLKVPLNAVKLLFLNGVHAGGDEVLQEGDRLGVFPPVAGG